MPGFDKTGPVGQGAQTGRKMGRCKNANETTDENFYGRGRRRGFGRMFRTEKEENSSETITRLFRRRRGKN